MKFLDKILGNALKPATPQFVLDARKRKASARGKCQRLAKRLGLVIENDSGIKTIEAGPLLESKYGITAQRFDELWPDERDIYDWQYTLRLLQEFSQTLTRTNR